jgi:hypothetical protein
LLRGGREDSARRKVIMQHFRGAHATGLARAGNETRGPCSLVRTLAGGHAMPSPGERKPRAEGRKREQARGFFFVAATADDIEKRRRGPPSPPEPPKTESVDHSSAGRRLCAFAPRPPPRSGKKSRSMRSTRELEGSKTRPQGFARSIEGLFSSSLMQDPETPSLYLFFNSPPARAPRPSRNSLELRKLRDSPRWGA